jgi:hypothetical protein
VLEGVSAANNVTVPVLPALMSSCIAS